MKTNIQVLKANRSFAISELMEKVKATNINQLMELGANVYEGKYLGNKVFFIRFKHEVELNGIVGKKFATGGLMRNGYKQISFGGKREGV